MKTKLLAVLTLACACAACAHGPDQGTDAQSTRDPLQNTKKLAAKGHATLYRNGAFQVPATTIHLIPPGPDAYDLAMELAGMRARQSFQESIKHARESVDIAKAGVDKSLSAAATINRGTSALAGEARSVTRLGADMVGAAPGAGSKIVGASVSYAAPAYSGVREIGGTVTDSSLDAARWMSGATDRTAAALMSGTVATAGGISQSTLATSRRHASFAAEKFVKGYAAAPGKVGARAGAVADAGSLSRFATAFEHADEWRSSASRMFTDVIVVTAASPGREAGRDFNAAADEIGRGARESGPTLAVLKSLRWVLQGIFWDATIKPVGKLTGATLGYITVNAVAYPALITVNEGAVTANLAVQVAWNTAAAGYDVTAPSGIAAVAGLFSAVELVGGQAAAGGTLAGGSVASGGTYVAGKTAAAATAGGGVVAGKTVEYVAAPLSAAGVAVGGSTLGVVAGTATAAAGAGLAVAGVAAEAGTRAAGAAAAATVGAGGSAVSVAAGTALGTYELAKAVVVPAGYNLGAGVVLSYGTVTQLGAQTVLAVSDASYMVLSLEGPKWVLYAAKGNVDNGENIPTGSVLDLKAMQKSGETFYAVPASEAEVNRVVGSVYGELPEAKAPAETASPSEDDGSRP